ncbi:MAG: transposase [Saprospiraceae bacterium]|nr:transposase [Saprospiraceae bacterium]
MQHFHCWADGRRKFIESMDNDKARRICIKPNTETLCNRAKSRDADSSYDERTIERQAAKPILDHFKDWLDKETLQGDAPITYRQSHVLSRYSMAKSLPNIQTMA